MSDIKNRSNQKVDSSSEFIHEINEMLEQSLDEVALNDIDEAFSELEKISEEELYDVSEVIHMNPDFDISNNVSNFTNIDSLGDLDEEELDKPVGMSYWTASRIEQFNFKFMKYQIKKLFDVHSSVKAVSDILSWIFKYPIFKKEKNIKLFSFQHLALMCDVCPHQLRSDLQLKAIKLGVYDKIEQKAAVVRTRRLVSLTYGTQKDQKAKILKTLLKRFKEGHLPRVQNEEQLVRLVNRKFYERRSKLLVSEDLFSIDNIRRTQRGNGERW